jgi:formate hydrogenlyase subunit 6/NADH:ubiquinone oxidoreductase subunit I
MKIGSMLGEILHSLFRRPATVRYPFGVRKAVPRRLRGILKYDPDKCVGCLLCMKDCPANAIEIIAVDKPNKRFIMRFNADRCSYCAQCVVNCRFHCIEMSPQEWERAALSRRAFTVYYGRDEDVKKYLESETEKVPEKKP